MSDNDEAVVWSEAFVREAANDRVRPQETWLVRHGETEWSRTGRHTGRSDIPLTDQGKREASMVGQRLQACRFARVLTSPLARALETCRLAGFGEVAEVRDELMEWDYGQDEGRTTTDILGERPGWTIWTEGVRGGETIEDVGCRGDRILAEVRATEGDVAVFAHGHVLRVLAARWVGLPPERGGLLALGAATVSVLGYERETPVIVRWNEDCQLRTDESGVAVPRLTGEGLR